MMKSQWRYCMIYSIYQLHHCLKWLSKKGQVKENELVQIPKEKDINSGGINLEGGVVVLETFHPS